MSVYNFPPKHKKDPQALLEYIAQNGADEFEDVLVIARTKEDESRTYATSHDAAFMAVVSLLIQDLAFKTLNGEMG